MYYTQVQGRRVYIRESLSFQLERSKVVMRTGGKTKINLLQKVHPQEIGHHRQLFGGILQNHCRERRSAWPHRMHLMVDQTSHGMCGWYSSCSNSARWCGSTFTLALLKGALFSQVTRSHTLQTQVSWRRIRCWGVITMMDAVVQVPNALDGLSKLRRNSFIPCCVEIVEQCRNAAQ